MPIVTVNPNDSTGTPLPSTDALRVVYQLSGVAGAGAVAFLTKRVYAYPDPITNVASINLIALDVLQPPGSFYAVWFEYLDAAANYTRMDEFNAKLYLGSTGGDLLDLLLLRPRPDQSWVSPGAVIPATAQSGDWLFDPTTDNFYQVI